MDANWNYIFLAAVGAYLIWRTIQVRKLKTQLPELLKDNPQIVDVRSPGEFESGHYEGSINIPVGDLPLKAGQLDPKRPVILCCASGSRSAMAAMMLKSKGFANVKNIGAWGNLC